MNFPDHPPTPLSFDPPPFPSSDVCDLWPQSPMESEHTDSQSQFEHVTPFKRPRNYDYNPPNSAPFPPVNPRTNLPNPLVNRGTSNIFFKTRMCVKFLDGNCRNGESCSFAHGFEDMREPPPNWQDIIREKDRGVGNWNDDQRIIHRMKICRKFYNGEECSYGEKCNFLHESPSKFKNDISIPLPRESSAISIGTMGPLTEHRSDTYQAEVNKHLNASLDAFRVNMKPTYWKTKMCSKWEITGQCPFGDRCHFAHGQSEVQVPGGHIEGEEMMDIGSIRTKALPLPVNDVPPRKMEVGGPTKECGENNNKGLSKWKLHRKINCIYGDWPEDLIPPENLPSAMVG